jgi:hypothetical protein
MGEQVWRDTMAETKTRASSTRGKTTKRKPAKARKSSAAKASNGASASRATKSRMSKTKGSSRSKNGAARVDAARNAVEETAKHAGHSVGDAASTVGRAASKAKTPLLASGAAIAGVAGGIALGARQARRSKLLPRGPKVKIDSRDLAKAAKEVGQFGVDIGQLASELRRNREQANGTKSHSRSPIEVVLQGLTSRGRRD